MSITRRDFLNGVAITIAAGVAPINLLKAAEGGSTLADKTLAYPPSPACAATPRALSNRPTVSPVTASSMTLPIFPLRGSTIW